MKNATFAEIAAIVAGIINRSNLNVEQFNSKAGETATAELKHQFCSVWGKCPKKETQSATGDSESLVNRVNWPKAKLALSESELVLAYAMRDGYKLSELGVESFVPNDSLKWTAVFKLSSKLFKVASEASAK